MIEVRFHGRGGHWRLVAHECRQGLTTRMGDLERDLAPIRMDSVGQFAQTRDKVIAIDSGLKR